MTRVKFSVKNKSCFCLNILIRKGVNVQKPRFYKDRLEFFTDLQSRMLCHKTLKDYNIEYKELSQKGFLVFFARNIKRAGLVVGLFVASVMLFVYSNCIFTLNIEGHKEVEREVIKEVASKHISPPAAFKRVNLKKLREDIIQIEGVSNASVERGGTTINITVLEELPMPDIENIKDEYEDVVSKYDSVVTRIVVTGGTPLVKKGQAVQKGQKLIGAYILADEDTTVYTKADGQVYGKVWLTKSKVITPQKLVYKKTGKTYTEYNIPIFNWVKKKKKVPFSHYELKTEKVLLGGGLNIEVEKTTYYETILQKVEVDVVKEAEIEVIRLFEKLEDEISDDMQRVRKWFEVKRLDKKVKIDIYYEVETLII